MEESERVFDVSCNECGFEEIGIICTEMGIGRIAEEKHKAGSHNCGNQIVKIKRKGILNPSKGTRLGVLPPQPY